MSCCACGGGVVRTAFSPASTCAGVVSGSGEGPGHGLALIDMPVVLWAPPPQNVIAIGHSRSLHSHSEPLLAGIMYIPSIRVTFGTSNCATLHSSQPDTTITCLVIPHHLCMLKQQQHHQQRPAAPCMHQVGLMHLSTTYC